MRREIKDAARKLLNREFEFYELRKYIKWGGVNIDVLTNSSLRHPPGIGC